MTLTRAQQLQAKIGQLKQLTQHTKVGVQDSEKLAQLSRQSLAVYSETEEVVEILKQMLTDLDERVAVLDELDARAQQLVSELNHRN
jgi:chromosome condensin MukBEF ATPase and DNA-binding subunit MukB